MGAGGNAGGVRGRSLSVPEAHGFQYEVQGGDSSPKNSEMRELREMLKLQQEQLNQLTQSFARLQGPNSRTQPFRGGPVICRRCQKPGHFARECEGERVTSRSPLRSRADPAVGGVGNYDPMRQETNSHRAEESQLGWGKVWLRR